MINKKRSYLTMRRKTTLLFSASCFLLLTFTSTSYSCVGRILNLTVNESAEQQLVAHIMATYITERTGTTVNVVNSTEDVGTQCPTDLCINYVNTGLSGMSSDNQGSDDDESYSLVKEYYIENENLVWLKPFGYKGPVTQDNASMAVPVANRESLVKFPILHRVINKLGNLIDNSSLEQLLQQSQGSDAESVAKDFLKTKNLI
ncbi:MAG: glycine betaine ABC transporter substrate-binding protein [Candidatus Electrothrix scaldis]|nr:MAG: glycine betaine ABC transporter substrate-binding protein [Candidatus Electrothrix sp. GW3-3]